MLRVLGKIHGQRDCSHTVCGLGRGHCEDVRVRPVIVIVKLHLVVQHVDGVVRVRIAAVIPRERRAAVPDLDATGWHEAVGWRIRRHVVGDPEVQRIREAELLLSPLGGVSIIVNSPHAPVVGRPDPQRCDNLELGLPHGRADIDDWAREVAVVIELDVVGQCVRRVQRIWIGALRPLQQRCLICRVGGVGRHVLRSRHGSIRRVVELYQEHLLLARRRLCRIVIYGDDAVVPRAFGQGRHRCRVGGACSGGSSVRALRHETERVGAACRAELDPVCKRARGVGRVRIGCGGPAYGRDPRVQNSHRIGGRRDEAGGHRVRRVVDIRSLELSVRRQCRIVKQRRRLRDAIGGGEVEAVVAITDFHARHHGFEDRAGRVVERRDALLLHGERDRRSRSGRLRCHDDHDGGRCVSIEIAVGDLEPEGVVLADRAWNYLLHGAVGQLRCPIDAEARRGIGNATGVARIGRDCTLDVLREDTPVPRDAPRQVARHSSLSGAVGRGYLVRNGAKVGVGAQLYGVAQLVREVVRIVTMVRILGGVPHERIDASSAGCVRHPYVCGPALRLRQEATRGRPWGLVLRVEPERLRRRPVGGETAVIECSDTPVVLEVHVTYDVRPELGTGDRHDDLRSAGQTDPVCSVDQVGAVAPVVVRVKLHFIAEGLHGIGLVRIARRVEAEGRPARLGLAKVDVDRGREAGRRWKRLPVAEGGEGQCEPRPGRIIGRLGACRRRKGTVVIAGGHSPVVSYTGAQCTTGDRCGPGAGSQPTAVELGGVEAGVIVHLDAVLQCSGGVVHVISGGPCQLRGERRDAAAGGRREVAYDGSRPRRRLIDAEVRDGGECGPAGGIPLARERRCAVIDRAHPPVPVAGSKCRRPLDCRLILQRLASLNSHSELGILRQLDLVGEQVRGIRRVRIARGKPLQQRRRISDQHTVDHIVHERGVIEVRVGKRAWRIVDLRAGQEGPGGQRVACVSVSCLAVVGGEVELVGAIADGIDTDTMRLHEVSLTVCVVAVAEIPGGGCLASHQKVNPTATRLPHMHGDGGGRIVVAICVVHAEGDRVGLQRRRRSNPAARQRRRRLDGEGRPGRRG